MDNQFNTLARSYHDNYIEYATTGGDSYRNGYESAQKGLEEIIGTLTKQVTENANNIKLAVGKSCAISRETSTFKSDRSTYSETV